MRRGATLTEVMMALLIMSVGVVSVFTLFPIALLRSIQSSQLTNAKIHARNTAATIHHNPTLLHTHQPPAGSLIGRAWEPDTAYQVGDVVSPVLKGFRPVPDCWFLCTTAGTSSIVEPTWAFDPMPDGTAEWEPMQTITFGTTVFDASQYVLDPLGWHVSRDDGSHPATEFGNRGGVSVGTLPMLRLNGGITNTDASKLLCRLDDSWEPIISITPLNVTATSVEFPPSVDLSGGAVGFRVTVSSADGQTSAVRIVVNRSGNIVSWPASVSLPQTLDEPDEVGDVRLEALDTRYTWLATVKRPTITTTVMPPPGPQPLFPFPPQGPPVPEPDYVTETGRTVIKVAILFNRSFLSESEHVYDANFGNTSPDVVTINWSAAEPAPLLKPGNWLLDLRDCEWHRIQSVDRGSGTADLTLNSTPEQTPLDAFGNQAPMGRAMLLPGIIEVFDL